MMPLHVKALQSKALQSKTLLSGVVARFLLIALGLIGLQMVGDLAGVAPQAWADDVLENSPVVRRNLQYRAARHEVAAVFGATLGDPYVRNLLPGARYDMHLYDWLSVGADLRVGIPMRRQLSDDIEVRVLKSNDTFEMDASHLRFLAGAHASVSPLIGKFVAFGSLPVTFDVHATIGFGAAGIAGSGRLKDSISMAPSVGGGTRVFLSRVLALTVEMTSLFIDRTLAVDRNSQPPGSQFRPNLMLTAGLSFFMPPELTRAE